ncbi:MAG: ABC transporter ATP-binding protein [Candidatus Thermoplasmatota archaeon]|nr:ABC transporter ATP-binding protein [Candidatus Thermoplasmatota archaeon]
MMLEIRGVSFSRGNFRLKELGLNAQNGDVVGIVGPNGSGKSTFLRIIAGILKKESGEIRYNDRDINEYQHMERPRIISMLSQETPNPFSFTVSDVIGTAGYFTGRPPEGIKRSLRKLGIENLYKRQFSQLSGGEKRLVMLATLIYQDADVCLMDEPFSFLDVDKSTKVFRIVRSLKDENKIVVVTMHDINMIWNLCDSVLLMKNGSMVASGTPEEVINEENLQKTYGIPFSHYDSPEGPRFVPSEFLSNSGKFSSITAELFGKYER